MVCGFHHLFFIPLFTLSLHTIKAYKHFERISNVYEMKNIRNRDGRAIIYEEVKKIIFNDE